MAHVPQKPVGQELSLVVDEETATENMESHARLEAALQEKRETIKAGWGKKYIERVHARDKLTARERIAGLVDAGTELFEIGMLVNDGVTFSGDLRSPGAGVVTGFGMVEQRWCVVIANDNTVASGAWWPNTPEKIQRAQEVALRLNLPVLYLVDCSGLFLPEQARSFAGATGAGHIFRKNSELSAAGVPQLAGVFGDCIAGGGYMPIISDRVYMTEQAYMVIAGAALIKGAKSQALTSLEIGGPEVHVHQSGCADVRVPDDETLLACLRREVSRLPSSAVPFYRSGLPAADTRFSSSEVRALVPTDPRANYDSMEFIARLCDLGLFWELQPDVGREVICGVTKVGGLYVGIVANRLGLIDHPDAPGRKRPGGSLYRDGIAKMATFCRACDEDGLPMFWLQDVAGFDIGKEAERQGLLGFGSSLIYANSTHRSPVFTILLRKASGAGYYAMYGRPYEPILQLSTPLTRLAVMEGRTLAIARYHSRLDDNFEIATDDPEERAAIEAGMAEVEQKIEGDMNPYRSSALMDTDEVIALGEIRRWMVTLLEMSYQSVGTRRTKNSRIWSLHDWDRLGRTRGATQGGGSSGRPSVVSSPPARIDVELGPHAVVLRAPSAGRLYLRPSPSAAAFVEVGSKVELGSPVALIEVMKTFHRIAYGGDGFPSCAVVTHVLCSDDAELSPGDPLFAFEPAAG